MTVGLFLGLTTVDFLFGVEAYPLEDSKTTALQYVAVAGGPATNAAIVFARLGGRSHLLSSVGGGELSEIAAADLRNQGIHHQDLAVTRSASLAVSAIVISKDNGTRTIFTNPAIDTISPLNENATTVSNLMAKSDILMLDGHQIEIAIKAASLAKERGIPVVLDGDLYKPHIDKLIPIVDIIIFGKSFQIPQCQNVFQTIAKLEALGAKNIVATQGAEPIIFSSSGKISTIPVALVDVVDTLAAGDFFHGAFCFYYTEMRDIERALQGASDIATRSVTRWGPREWLSSL